MHLRSCSKSQAIISVGTCNSVLFINFPYSEKTGVRQLIFKKEKTVENNSLMPPIYIVTSLTKTKKCMHYWCLKVFFSSNSYLNKIENTITRPTSFLSPKWNGGF